MLSYIYQIAHYFERSHGTAANALYLNQQHFQRLQASFANPADMDNIREQLGMQVIISNEAAHPHLAYLENLIGSGFGKISSTQSFLPNQQTLK